MKTVQLYVRRIFNLNGELIRFTMIELLIVIAIIAILAAMLATGMPIEDAVRIANRAGGIVVGKLGTVAVSYEELFA